MLSADYRQMFLVGGQQRGVPVEPLEEVWSQILSFAGYSFCKPHSASYALVSCKSAFLKANHPAEFMAAVISNQGGYYTPFAYLSEARRMGLTILPPDINESVWPYAGEGRTVRVGLMQVEGLARKAAEALLREREKRGSYSSFDEFLRRVAIDPADAKRLVKAGCFDGLDKKERRPALQWELLRFQHHFDRQGSGLLFEEPAAELPAPSAYDDRTVLRQEVETLGILISCHPLLLHRRELAKLKPVPAARMGDWVGRYITMIGWWVTGKTVQARDDRPMEFVTFEDTTAIFDATFFPQAYERFCRKLSRSRPYLLKGKVEEEYGVATLTVEWVGFVDGGPE